LGLSCIFLVCDPGNSYLLAGATDIKQLGLPLSQRDIVKLVHKSLSGVAEQDVQFRYAVFPGIMRACLLGMNWLLTCACVCRGGDRY
jgi:hypothetical protein